MFNLPRFGKLLRWLWHRTPLWYVFAPFAAAFVVTMFIYFAIGPSNDYRELYYPYFDIDAVIPYGVMTMLLGALPMAIHLCSRHLAKPQEGIAYYSLPASTPERYLALLIGLFIIIPLWSMFCLVSFYALLNLASGLVPYPFPNLSQAWPYFQVSLIPYFASVVFALGITILRPKQAFVWYVGVGITLMIILPLLATNVVSTDFFLELPETVRPVSDNLVGSQAHNEWHQNTSNYAMNSKWTAIIPAIVATLGFATVAFLGLRHKQV